MNAIPKIKIEMTATVTMTEEELRALNGILGYDVDHFLRAFYEKCGKSYVKPYESGVRSLHSNLRAQLQPWLSAMNDIRRRAQAAGINKV